VSTQGAPVSGPGRLARRTDRSPSQKIRELPDAQYGEASEFNSLQKQAPLENVPKTGPAPAPTAPGTQPGGMPLSSVIPLNAPTQRPDEPVTAGSNFGPGPGPEALGNAGGQAADYSSARSTLQSIAAASNNPEAAALLKMLQTRL
jgi:hypothetical protein